MKKEITQLQAIIGSVYKWWKIVYKGGNDTGTDNCTLCVKYFKKESDCKSCPVDKKSHSGCINTPYTDWDDTVTYNIGNKNPYSIKLSRHPEKARTAARAELMFLFRLIVPSQFERVRLDLIGSGSWEKNAGIKRLPNQFLDWMEKAMEAKGNAK